MHAATQHGDEFGCNGWRAGARSWTAEADVVPFTGVQGQSGAGPRSQRKGPWGASRDDIGHRNSDTSGSWSAPTLSY